MPIESQLRQFVDAYRIVLDEVAEADNFKGDQRRLVEFRRRLDLMTKYPIQTGSRIKTYSFQRWYDGIFVEGVYFPNFIFSVRYDSSELRPGTRIAKPNKIDPNARISFREPLQIEWKEVAGAPAQLNESEYGYLFFYVVNSRKGSFISRRLGKTTTFSKVEVDLTDDRRVRGARFDLDILELGEIDSLLLHLSLDEYRDNKTGGQTRK